MDEMTVSPSSRSHLTTDSPVSANSKAQHDWTTTSHIISLSTLSFNVLICPMSSLASFVVMLAAMTARDTPLARPNATLLGTYTYGTFLSSQRRGRWRRMARGEVSAARMMISAVPRLRVFVAVPISGN